MTEPGAGPRVRRVEVGDDEGLDSLVALNADTQAFHVAAAPLRYHPADAAEVRVYLGDMLARPDVHAWLLRHGDIDVAYAVAVLKDVTNPFAPPSRVLLVDQVGVRADARRKGHGRALMAWVLAHSARLGCDRVELNVADFNEEAFHFYRSLGFSPWSVRLSRPPPP